MLFVFSNAAPGVTSGRSSCNTLSRSVPARQSLTSPAAKANWRKLRFFFRQITARSDLLIRRTI